MDRWMEESGCTGGPIGEEKNPGNNDGYLVMNLRKEIARKFLGIACFH